MVAPLCTAYVNSCTNKVELPWTAFRTRLRCRGQSSIERLFDASARRTVLSQKQIANHGCDRASRRYDSAVLSDGEMFAGYRIVRQLGAGGMGEVYLAQHPRLSRQDAIKILPAELTADRDFAERFRREADLTASLWHPHIIGLHDRGEFDGRSWISMDFVNGTDAAHLLADSGALPAKHVVAIVDAIADALDFAHQR